MFCNGNESKLTVVILFLILASFISISSVFITIQFIIRYRTRHKSSKLLYRIGLLFCIISCTYFISSAIGYPIALCSESVSMSTATQSLFLIIRKLTYTLNCYLLWIILFIELVLVFEESMFKLSSKIIKTWISLFLMALSIYIVYWIIYFDIYVYHGRNVSELTDSEIVVLALSTFLVWCLVFCVPTCLSYSFVSRLIKIYRTVDRSKIVLTPRGNRNGNIQDAKDSLDRKINDRMLSSITRMTILTVFSAIFTMLVMVYYLILHDDFKLHARGWIYLLDAYSNFICIMLSYDIFEGYYRRLCHCVDKRCRRYCYHYANKNIDRTESDVSDYHEMQELSTGS